MLTSLLSVSAATDVPTTLDEVLMWLENGLNAVLDIIGPFIGLDYDETKQVEADIHALVNDIRELGDGRIDVDTGLENILTDILVILGDFGVPTSQRRDGLTSKFGQVHVRHDTGAGTLNKPKTRMNAYSIASYYWLV